MTPGDNVERGRPAAYGDEIVRRRYRIAAGRLPLEGKLILDFGCGNGAQTLEFLDAVRGVIGVDVDDADLQTFAAYLRSNGIAKALPVRYDGDGLPLADHTVDAALSFEVLEHVRNESRALSEIHRVLKPGGSLILSVPNKWWIFETHGARLPLLPWNRIPFVSWLPAPLHRRIARARIYRRRQIIRLLQKAHFDVQGTTFVTAPLDVITLEPVKRLLRRVLFRNDETSNPFLATAIMVVATKG